MDSPLEPASTFKITDDRGASMTETRRSRNHAEVLVKAAIEPNERIVIEWPGYSGPTTVEWKFTPRDDGTFVSVTESGFSGTGDELVKYVADSTQGFTLTLAGMKALLEHDVRLNLVADRYPGGLAEGACS
jgi:uncharacterized protein YndB with AHSA1/START domain